MIEQATVSEVRGQTIVLDCKRRGSCKSCGSAFCRTDTRSFEAANSRGLELSPGDVVDVYLAPGKTIAAGFMVLIVPLFLFVVAYLVVGRISPAASEGIRALFGLGGLGAGFGLSWLFSRTRGAAELPEIAAVRALAKGDHQC